MKTLTIDDVALAQATASQPASRKKVWAGRVLAGLPLLFLAWDAAMKFAAIPEVVEASARLGFSRGTLPVLGALELLGVVLALFARTRVLGAALLTAYLGGAVETHVRLGDPLLTHTLFPVYFAAMIWGGFCLIDQRVLAVSPFSRR
jgi:hypothetical protein